MGTAIDEAVAPTGNETALARESSERLSQYLDHDLRLNIPANGRNSQSVTLPAVAVRLLVRILAEMAQGNAITLIPIHAELTTQDAADLLNVSRPHLIKILDEGKIPYHRTGTHRRIRFEDLVKYKRASDRKREKALAALVKEGQELGMGY